MKTQEFKLDFKKSTLVELNEEQLLEIDGGTSSGCYFVASLILGGLYELLK